MRVFWSGTFDSEAGFLYLSYIPLRGLFITFYVTITQERTLCGRQTPEEDPR